MRPPLPSIGCRETLDRSACAAINSLNFMTNPNLTSAYGKVAGIVLRIKKGEIRTTEHRLGLGMPRIDAIATAPKLEAGSRRRSGIRRQCCHSAQPRGG